MTAAAVPVSRRCRRPSRSCRRLPHPPRTMSKLGRVINVAKSAQKRSPSCPTLIRQSPTPGAPQSSVLSPLVAPRRISVFRFSFPRATNSLLGVPKRVPRVPHRVQSVPQNSRNLGKTSLELGSFCNGSLDPMLRPRLLYPPPPVLDYRSCRLAARSSSSS